MLEIMIIIEQGFLNYYSDIIESNGLSGILKPTPYVNECETVIS
jgi:hypothetical protein